MTTTEELPSWQRGYELEELRAVADRFRAEEQGRVIGRFLGTDERWVAERLAEDRLFISDGCAIAVRQYRSVGRWIAHHGEACADIGPGDWIVERMIGDPEEAAEILDGLHGEPISGLLAVLPHGPSAILAQQHLGLGWAGAKVPAGGEVVGMWAKRPLGREPTKVELAAAIHLPISINPDHLSGLLADLSEAELPWAQHYSGYNLRRSWTALSLRGYGPEITDVEKPAEMSKAWKKEHPGWEDARCQDTPLRAELPSVEAILDQLGITRPDRIRLMRLAEHDKRGRPGELSRHADIVDHEAGFSPGELARIHVPLLTNPGVLFSVWSIDHGFESKIHMRLGEAWALDQTKPHAAVNEGETGRVHLVIDCPIEGRVAELMERGVA